MAEKNRRLIQGEDIVYPITKQENIIHLQKTITDKLPIVSDTTPTSGYVPKQVWLDTGTPQSSDLQFGTPSSGQLTFGQQQNNGLTFGQPSNNQLTFGQPNSEENNQEKNTNGKNISKLYLQQTKGRV